MFFHKKSLLFLSRLFSLTLITALGGCISMNVGTRTKEIAASQFRKPAIAAPVQVEFEIVSNGAKEPAATKAHLSMVLAQVRDSGLFTSVSESPVESGAKLNILINSVIAKDGPQTSSAAGAAAGATGGLIGTSGAEDSFCTATFKSSSTAAALVKKSQQRTYVKIGAAGFPADSVNIGGLADTTRLVIRQVVSNVLNDLSQDPSFASGETK